MTQKNPTTVADAYVLEGFMATGVASEATDEAIQANIVAAQYSGFNFPAGEGPDA